MTSARSEFVGESLFEIIEHIRARLCAGERVVTIRVLDPDLGRGLFPGERVEHVGRWYVHRPFRVWVDLAERIGMRLLTPHSAGGGLIELRFEVLQPSRGWQTGSFEHRERYGVESGFGRISKLEDPGLILDVDDALRQISLEPDARILDLGVNTGDELTLLTTLRPELRGRASFVGIDHSPSAIAEARRRFPAENYRFIEADINHLDRLDIGTFDLIVSIATLQSPGVDDRELLRHLVQRRLTAKGALLLGIPNCCYVDGEQVHGARMKNFSEPELSLVIKDIAFFKRYLQQHKRQVRVTGRNYLIVTAVPC